MIILKGGELQLQRDHVIFPYLIIIEYELVYEYIEQVSIHLPFPSSTSHLTSLTFLFYFSLSQ